MKKKTVQFLKIFNDNSEKFSENYEKLVIFEQFTC